MCSKDCEALTHFWSISPGTFTPCTITCFRSAVTSSAASRGSSSGSVRRQARRLSHAAMATAVFPFLSIWRAKFMRASATRLRCWTAFIMILVFEVFEVFEVRCLS